MSVLLNMLLARPTTPAVPYAQWQGELKRRFIAAAEGSHPGEWAEKLDEALARIDVLLRRKRQKGDPPACTFFVMNKKGASMVVHVSQGKFLLESASGNWRTNGWVEASNAVWSLRFWMLYTN